uniref:Large envelope protein n=1 Tax=Crowned shrew hepatitis B virus TaxID=2596879 RepID=A0A516RTR8_9HEPA|nr:surface [Crowned shrew hepatitis B virus]
MGNNWSPGANYGSMDSTPPGVETLNWLFQKLHPAKEDWTLTPQVGTNATVANLPRVPYRTPPAAPPQPGTRRLPRPLMPSDHPVHAALSQFDEELRESERERSLVGTAGAPSDYFPSRLPAGNIASAPSSVSEPTGDPVLVNMSNEYASRFLGPLAGLPVVFFLWTKTQEILQKLDWWWISLNFPGGILECGGRDLQSQTSRHSLISCPPTCSGYPLMCRRRFIILLFLLLLCLICWLGYLDYSGLIPVCPMGITGSSTTIQCKSCTGTATGSAMKPLCCCTKTSDGGNCTCVPIPPSWAFAKFLWEWASLHFSWLNSLLQLFRWLEGISPTVLLLLIWMMWYWVPSISTILNLFIPLFLTFWFLWG